MIPCEVNLDVEDRVGWTVHYELSDQPALEYYLKVYAPIMRAHGIERLKNRFTSHRRVVEFES